MIAAKNGMHACQLREIEVTLQSFSSFAFVQTNGRQKAEGKRDIKPYQSGIILHGALHPLQLHYRISQCLGHI